MQLKQNNMPLVANQYTYDAMSRLVTVSDGTNTATYSRISGSNLLNTTTITQGANTRLTTTRNYDAQNRLTSISSTAGAVTKTYSYTYNDKDRRSRLDMADGSYWTYTYDAKGQIVSGAKYDSANKAIPGQSFTYSYDDIGNLTSEQRGMTEMQFDYTSNLVNQYTQRLVPGIIPVTGQASADSTVSVWLKNHGANAAAVVRPTRDGEYFKAAIPVNNSAVNVTEALEITAVKFNTTLDKDVVKTINGSYTVPKTPQVFTYDDDGNALSDGVWNYTWNGENRLVKAEKTNSQKVEFAYDYMGRRTAKIAYNWINSAWVLSKTERYAYDGWNLIAVYDANGATLQKSFLWGEDVSCSLQGAGGIGGLLTENSNSTSYYPVYDGNGNVCAYFDATGTLVAEYSYGPFGQIDSKFGTLADNFSFRFSTKFLDAETGLSYYGIRYYTPEFNRWLSKDPAGEFTGNGLNLLYAFVANNPVSRWDYLGMWGSGLFGTSIIIDTTHQKMTTQAFNNGAMPNNGKRFKKVPQKILQELNKYNADVDGQYVDDLRYHFLRPLLGNTIKERETQNSEAFIEEWRNKYSQNIVDRKQEFDEGIATGNFTGCAEAIKQLGYLSHIWQDYYAHAIYLGSDGSTGTIGQIRGNPDSPSRYVKPASWGGNWYNGEHGGWTRRPGDNRIEPGDRASDSGSRHEQSISFTKDKYNSLLFNN